jgi:hypothetical protein
VPERGASDRGHHPRVENGAGTVVAFLFLGVICLMMAGFGFLPVTSEERAAERRSWRGSEPMSGLDRVFRQRADLLRRARWPLLIAGVLGIVAGFLALVIAVA